MREVIITPILEGSDQKKRFFEGCFWFKFNNLGLALGMALKFNTNVAERLKLKVRNFWELIPISAEVIREKLVGGRGVRGGGFFNITSLICDTLNMLL